MAANPLAKRYARLKALANKDLKSDAVGAELASIITLSMDFVSKRAKLVKLISNVPGKTYAMVALKTGIKTSRPINTALFDFKLTDAELAAVVAGTDIKKNPRPRLDQLLYTAAMSFCVASDLIGEGNKKSPGTFFEIFIGHLVALTLKVNPAKKVVVPTIDAAETDNTLPTDFIFDLGPGKSRIHMPVKTSTRERVVQAWAHQRVLEGMLGAGRYKGVLVVLTETNKQKDVSVVEVCLPGQWRAYQMYIAPMFRVYYLDLPKAYEPLRDKYPFIQIWPFSRFFGEYEQLGKAGP
jgi:hypothetical protein